jgi:putative MATE family efflux protein
VNRFDDALISGSIYRSVWRIAWPVITLNLVNGLHALVDHILVGHYVQVENNAGNAAIGAAWQVFLVLVVFIASVFHGMNVLIARYAGRRDQARVSHVAYEAFISAVYVLVLVVAPAGYFIAPYLLDFIEADAVVHDLALPYLRLLFCGGSPLFLMFMITGAFQAAGDPKTPLMLGVLTTVLNVVISYILIVHAGLGTIGAALGTVLAPMVTVSVALTLIMSRKMIILPPDHFRLIPNLAIMKTVVRIGIPTGVQGVLLNIGGVLLLRYLGTLEDSAAATAAYVLCYSQLFSVVTWTSFGLRAAAGTLSGQNLGAEKPERAAQCVYVAAAFGAVWAGGWGVVYWFQPETLLGLFNVSSGPELTLGTSLLRYLAFSGIALATTLGLTGGLQGAGDTKSPMYIAFLTQILVLLGICQGFQMAGTLTAERIWQAILISHSSRLVLTWLAFRYGKWAHIKVELEH